MLDVKATEDLWKKLIELWDNQTVLIVEHKLNISGNMWIAFF